jgi:hypothetical protein
MRVVEPIPSTRTRPSRARASDSIALEGAES